ncbi:hypothetical protein KCU81_g1508, partial [Aureobasidium melanogenum]|uniref:Uncharacterized protein n=2 Tax=Aureobasidium melanogenum TaxID=46634 RepID=A0A074W3Z6_AURM1
MSEPVTDEKQQKQRELQASYEALKRERNNVGAECEQEKTHIEAKYEHKKELIDAKLEIVKLAKHKMELETHLHELDADLRDILSNLDENLPTADPHHRAVIKAIFTNARSEGRFFANPADTDDLDMDDLMHELE